VEYTDDGKFIFIKTHSACPRHESVAHSQAHFDQVLVENQQKNQIVGEIQAATPTAGIFFNVDPQTGVMTVKASVIPPPLLTSLKRKYPKAMIAVDLAIPLSVVT
jgi:hypothetical protein